MLNKGILSKFPSLSYSPINTSNLLRLLPRYNLFHYLKSNLKENKSGADEIPYKYVDPHTEKIYNIDSYKIADATKLILKSKNIEKLFPVQGETISEIMQGTDLIVRSRTGTGKTLAFAIPLIEKLYMLKDEDNLRDGLPKILVICPTRELSIQVNNEFFVFGPDFRYCNAYGGGSPVHIQESILRRGVDVVIGTPGRLLDLINRNALNLSKITALILDEADHMLDMGFKEDIEQIIQVIDKSSQGNAPNYQTCLFSATIPDWVKQAGTQFFKRPERLFIDVVGDSKIRTSENITQIAIPYCENSDLGEFLTQIILTFSGTSGRTIIFSETKRQVKELGQYLSLPGSILSEGIGRVGVLHGDMEQSRRENILRMFKEKQLSCVLATDVASRGLDIADVDLVIQIEPPRSAESFIHRAGRTARAGKGGVNVVLYDPKLHSKLLLEIEKTAGIKITKRALEVGKKIAHYDSNTLSLLLQAISAEDKSKAKSFSERLLKDMNNNPDELISALIAFIYKEPFILPAVARSLLTGEKGFSTFIFKMSKDSNNTSNTRMFSSINSIIQNILKQAKFLTINDITSYYLLSDGTGIIFDIPFKHTEMLKKFDEIPEFSEIGSISPAFVLPNYITDSPEPSKAYTRSQDQRGYNNRNSGGYVSYGNNRNNRPRFQDSNRRSDFNSPRTNIGW